MAEDMAYILCVHSEEWCKLAAPWGHSRSSSSQGASGESRPIAGKSDFPAARHWVFTWAFSYLISLVTALL
jgi:hypothetical protein